MKTKKDVEYALKRLREEKREEVEAIVRRHVTACRRLGVAIDCLNRVWVEAYEVAMQDGPSLLDEKWDEYTPFQRYIAYIPPANLMD